MSAIIIQLHFISDLCAQIYCRKKKYFKFKSICYIQTPEKGQDQFDSFIYQNKIINVFVLFLIYVSPNCAFLAPISASKFSDICNVNSYKNKICYLKYTFPRLQIKIEHTKAQNVHIINIRFLKILKF